MPPERGVAGDGRAIATAGFAPTAPRRTMSPNHSGQPAAPRRMKTSRASYSRRDAVGARASANQSARRSALL